MKNGIIAFFCAALLCLGTAMTASAGSIVDTDTDLIPDVFDNCPLHANGPGGSTGSCSNQEDADNNGWGNPCDGDLNNSGLTDGQDFTLMFGLLFQAGNAGDLNCSGLTDGVDFTLMFNRLFKAPGAL